MDELRKRSGWLARAIGGLAILLLIVPTIVGIAVVSGRRHYVDLLVGQLPVLFYAWALWSVRGALAAYAGGGTLTARAGKSIEAVGACLFLGGLCDVFAVPLLLRVLHGQGSYAAFDMAAMTLGGVGLALVVIGRLLADAEAARRELDEFV
jgi:Protein of unknown function (DUF2975)